MRLRFLVAFLIGFSSALSAISLDEVDYAIPKNLTDWTLLNEVKGNRGEARVYAPPQNGPFDAIEIFGVSANDKPNSALDEASLKESVQVLFPGLTVESKMIEKEPHTATFEWRVVEDDKTQLFGLSKIITTEKGTVLLSYQTEIPEKIQVVDQEWLPVIKGAKLKEETGLDK